MYMKVVIKVDISGGVHCNWLVMDWEATAGALCKPATANGQERKYSVQNVDRIWRRRITYMNDGAKHHPYNICMMILQPDCYSWLIQPAASPFQSAQLNKSKYSYSGSYYQLRSICSCSLSGHQECLVIQEPIAVVSRNHTVPRC